MTLATMQPAPRGSPLQRASSPRVNRMPSQRRPSQAAKRSNSIRQPSTLSELLGQPLELVAENSREEGESPVPPDHISTSASEDSGASNSSQTKILDFIGATCEVTSWFTSCFPCAVVDIDEHDGQVAGRLSKESAMNALYSPTKVEANNEPLPEEAPQYNEPQCVERDEPQRTYPESPPRRAIDTEVVYTHLPIMTVAESDLIRAQGKKLSVIADDDATEVETISLDSERQHSPVFVTNRKKRIVPKKMKKLFKGGKKKNSGRKV